MSGITTEVKPGYFIHYLPEYLNSEEILLKAFSKKDFTSEKIYRKYIGQVSHRAYYPDGRKKWFFHMVFRYEFRIPKKYFELIPEKSGGSYIYYSLGKSLIVNNTSGGSYGTGAWADWQDKEIHRCGLLGKRDFAEILKFAIPNERTLEEAEAPFPLDFDLVTFLFIERYANGKTNYNKATKRYGNFSMDVHPFVRDMLSEGCWMSKQTLAEWSRALLKGLPGSGIMEMLFEYLTWCDLYRGREIGTIPIEVLEAFNRIRRR